MLGPLTREISDSRARPMETTSGAYGYNLAMKTGLHLKRKVLRVDAEEGSKIASKRNGEKRRLFGLSDGEQSSSSSAQE